MANSDDQKSGATNPGPFVVAQPCLMCEGQGAIDEQPCLTCHGTGVRRFFHGTKADLRPGDLIAPGYSSNFGNEEASCLRLPDRHPGRGHLGSGAGRRRRTGPDLRGGTDRPRHGRPQPDGQEVPGQSDESYRSREPLRVTGEVTDWQGHAPEALKAMKDNLERLKRLGVEAIDD